MASPKPVILTFDSLDDRREIVTILDHLPPKKRVAWLDWCCRQVAGHRPGMNPRVKQATRDLADRARWDTAASDRLTVECYGDYLHLCFQYDLDAIVAIKVLESFVKRPGDVPLRRR